MGLRASSFTHAQTRPKLARIIDPRVFAGVAGVLLAAQWIHAVTEFGDQSVADFFSRWVYVAIVVASGSAVLLTAMRRRPVRKSWCAFGVGLISLAIGDVIYNLAPNLDKVPVPSISDPFWLLFYPLAYVGLLLMVRDRVRISLMATRLDGIICGVSAASILACVSLPLAVASSADSAFWETATNLAYPVCDLVLFGAVVSAIALSGWRVDRSLAVLGAGILAWEAADLMYLFNTLGDVADALVLTGAVGIASAALLERRVLRHARESDRGLFVPVAFGAVSLAVLIGGAALRWNMVGLGLAAAALGLVLVRMALALAENRALLGESRVDATTDSLTGLGNRRKLRRDLARVLETVSVESPHALVLLDLNGFKTYNDTFGHAAGDALLAQLGSTLAAAVTGRGEAYRMGGDEFCVLGPCSDGDSEQLSAYCAGAIAARGDGFSITAAHGVALMPVEANNSSDVLSLADVRMYRNKANGGRPRAADELASVLCAVLEERAPDVADHSRNVRDLAVATGALLGMPEDELATLRRAAALHDLGKTAIPDSILQKPGPLTSSEWDLIRQHTIIGQRILSGAPALQHVGQLIRRSHERYDGTGYPDRLSGEAIPLSSRIIAVADAFDAMTTRRPYNSKLSDDAALAELRRCAGSQFDPGVTAAFEQTVHEQVRLEQAA
jgi:diguanylate cyclase (GGDEF)-like protein